MAEIIIKNMKMPEKCADCPLWNAEREACQHPDTPAVENPCGEALLIDCPLKERPTVLYLCDRRDPTCSTCLGPCNATKNIEHAAGFVRTAFGDYADLKLFMRKHQRSWDDQAIATKKVPIDD